MPAIRDGIDDAWIRAKAKAREPEFAGLCYSRYPENRGLLLAVVNHGFEFFRVSFDRQDDRPFFDAIVGLSNRR